MSFHVLIDSIHMKIHLKLLIFLLLTGSMSFAQTEGELSVSVTTSKAGGEFAPKNVVAVWVENSSGEFVKTLLTYANKRKGYLTHWKDVTTSAGSAYNAIDAVTGATQNSHGNRTCSWNGKDFQGNAAADGVYRICMELTDKNGTGNYSTFEMTKSTNVYTLTPPDVPSFSSVQLAWTPSQTSAVDAIPDYNQYEVYPSPTTGLLEIKGKNIQSVEISNMIGQTIYIGNSNSADISSNPNGIYFVKIKTNDHTIIKRIVKL